MVIYKSQVAYCNAADSEEEFTKRVKKCEKENRLKKAMEKKNNERVRKN